MRAGFFDAQREIGSRGQSLDLDVRRLTANDVASWNGKPRRLSEAFLDERQEYLAPFPSLDDLLRRINRTFGGIFFAPDGARGVKASLQWLRSNRVAENLSDAIAGKYIVGQGIANVATLFSFVSREVLDSGLMRPFLNKVFALMKEQERDITQIFTLTPMIEFADWIGKLTDQFMKASGASRIFEGRLESYRKLVLGTSSVQQLEELGSACEQTDRLAAFYNLNGVDSNGKMLIHNGATGRHMSAGAGLKHLRRGADKQDRYRRSLGYMVNLQYEVERLDVLSEDFRLRRIVNCSAEIAALAGNVVGVRMVIPARSPSPR